jgi:hypothetical protein
MNILNFRFELSNMLDRWEFFKPLGSLSGRLFWHKAWELEHSYMSTMLIDIDVSLTARRDHAGLNITVGLLGYGVHFSLYDTRHWDYKQNAYAQNNS